MSVPPPSSAGTSGETAPGETVTGDTEATGAEPAEGARVFLDITLYPHRSLRRKGFRLLIGTIAAICLLAALRFFTLGAWPVVIFVAVDVAAIWLAFYLNYRSGKIRERVRLTTTDMTVTRRHPGGRRDHWHLEPYWMQVQSEDRAGTESALILKSHGRELRLGAFLNAPERREVAAEIDAALAAWRAR